MSPSSRRSESSGLPSPNRDATVQAVPAPGVLLDGLGAEREPVIASENNERGRAVPVLELLRPLPDETRHRPDDRLEALPQRAVAGEGGELLVEAVVPVDEETHRAGNPDALGVMPVRGELELFLGQSVAAQKCLRQVTVAGFRQSPPRMASLQTSVMVGTGEKQ